jgi:hypothetical protein
MECVESEAINHDHLLFLHLTSCCEGNEMDNINLKHLHIPLVNLLSRSNELGLMSSISLTLALSRSLSLVNVDGKEVTFPCP